MIIQSEHLHVALKHGFTFELSGARGIELSCLAGAIWITQHQQIDDWVLQSGQFLTITSNGKIVISASKEGATFSAQQPAREHVKSSVAPTLNSRNYSLSRTSGVEA
ncbi:MAG: DUF2917 domain-containing protein [Propionivibrio sp.]|uniref:DUF2917 domain-containing protein n=1 Tax=Propionivibrio sp. TaxID=2212460 RepID=UPI001A564199|nr:DUF2917 domain-containing protein [Propionivibrio sp.]MBL8414699.1 DUF2917 domain-containing protein [Propionivibrio sp.]